ncbi:MULTISPECIES: hypothetical protein [Wolbachia]|uniref:hypothetical protein n=2 Tax=Wolbachieae TaxID=952 RepID=UPI0002404111|nr:MULTISPECIES: hypothetical protein [Wolbachia]UYC23123.1 hypothetical protein L3551_04280 [Wolbachia endosymbiont of Aedes aegypti]QBB83420.1 hypothetical protein DEJ70_00810 [Wolbachia pipientis wAlbB]QDW08233.1 hypothetical protein CO539_000810 [Wolbachia pipientis]QDW09421.1 hypothetical protein CO538_000810 [Wolbachia pipientis]QZA83621.1 hypothetical protein K1Y75_00780 [Wolbachia pipientis]
MKNIKEKGLSSAKVKYSVEPTVSENAEVNTFEECFGACYNKYQHDEKLMGSCIRGCQYRFGHNWDLDAPESKESEPIYTSEVLKNIGDNFHALADSVSIL